MIILKLEEKFMNYKTNLTEIDFSCIGVTQFKNYFLYFFVFVILFINSSKFIIFTILFN